MKALGLSNKKEGKIVRSYLTPVAFIVNLRQKNRYQIIEHEVSSIICLIIHCLCNQAK